MPLAGCRRGKAAGGREQVGSVILHRDPLGQSRARVVKRNVIPARDVRLPDEVCNVHYQIHVARIRTTRQAGIGCGPNGGNVARAAACSASGKCQCIACRVSLYALISGDRCGRVRQGDKRTRT